MGVMMRSHVYSNLRLPEDIILHILTFLNVQDILSLRSVSNSFLSIATAVDDRTLQTCIQLSKVTRLRWVWFDALARHVLSQGLVVPKPMPDLNAASARDLERNTVRATRLHDNWSTACPVPRRKFEFDAGALAKFAGVDIDGDDADSSADKPHAGVSQVLCLPGSGGEVILSVLGRRHIVVARAPMGKSYATALAHWTAPEGHSNLEICANQDLASEATFAVTTISRKHGKGCGPSSLLNDLVLMPWVTAPSPSCSTSILSMAPCTCSRASDGAEKTARNARSGPSGATTSSWTTSSACGTGVSG